MGNALVKTKKAGEQHLELLLAGELSENEITRLDEIHVELDELSTQSNELTAAITMRQADLIKEAGNILRNDASALDAWFNKADGKMPFSATTSRRIKRLEEFCRKKTTKPNMPLETLYLLSDPKWIQKGTVKGSKDAEKSKVVSTVYSHMTKLKPGSQTPPKAKDLLEKAMHKAGIPLPATKTPPKWKVGQAEDATDRLLVKIFQSFEGMPEIKYLKQHILKEMQGW